MRRFYHIPLVRHSLYNTAAGIEIDPTQLGGGLTRAAGRLKMLCGELVSEWTIVVPPNTTATLYLPGSVAGAEEITLNRIPISDFTYSVEVGQYHVIVRGVSKHDAAVRAD